MDYTEKYQLIKRLTAEDLLDIIHMFINAGGDNTLREALTRRREWTLSDGSKVTSEEIGVTYNWHRTLQQGLMRGFIVPAIRSLASQQNPDARNMATVLLCRELLPIVNKYHLPFI